MVIGQNKNKTAKTKVLQDFWDTLYMLGMLRFNSHTIENKWKYNAEEIIKTL